VTLLDPARGAATAAPAEAGAPRRPEQARGTATAAPAEAARGTARLGTALRTHGDQPALAAADGWTTYRDLAERVDDVARRLGPVPRLVHVPLPRTVPGITGYLGALAGGHAVLVTDDDPGRSAEIAARFDPDVVLDPRGGSCDVLERRDGTRHQLHPDLALLLSTSGSMGAPRLVRLSHANLLSNARAIADYLGLTADDRAITSLPLHYCYGLSVLHSHLLVGAGIVVTDLSVVDRCFWDAFRHHGVTSLAGVPHTFELLERGGFGDLDAPSLRLVTQAGGRLDPAHVRRLARQGERDGWELVVMYGQTEATARMAYLPPSLAAAHPSAIGIPIPGGTLRLEPCDAADDGVGELVYEGPNVMLGYAESPADLGLGATVEALRTGDLARRNEAGLFELVGRRARFAKVCGLRVDLDEVEATLRTAGVEALCTSDDERLAVVAVAADREPVARLVAGRTGLPAWRIAVATVDELPRLSNGKPDHRRVLALATHGAADAAEPAADGRVHAVYERVLGVPAVTDDDTFIALGGDSLSYVEASIALERIVGALPSDWPSRPVGSLVPADRRRWSARIETSVVLRALSIVLIVSMHVKLTALMGGAHLLLTMAGYSFGRFQPGPVGRLRSIARIAVPSALWLALATQLNDRIDLAHVLLLNGWFGADDAHGGYWFGEALVQILLPVTAVLAIPAVRRAEGARPLAVAATALAVGLLVRFHVIDLPTVEPHDIRPHDTFWLFALGWAAAHARAPLARLALSAVALAALPGYFGEPQREVFLIAALLVLLWVPSLPVPRVATRAIGLVAGASLYIYLTHWQVFGPVRAELGKPAALVAALVAGVALWRLIGAVEARVRRLRWSGAPPAGAARAPAPTASWLG
jgi:acyl-CoA synthetase (AMP-forming)/AMP-acid ligase II